MIDRVRQKLFDNWALQYDQAVANASGEYPFDGYEAALSALVASANPRQGDMVLDLGTGTGNLAGRFAGLGCGVWGIDFSKTMLEQARSKFPELTLVQADLLQEWPRTLPSAFDLVVSAYVLHEFDLFHKVRLLNRVAEDYLKPGGRILVADIAFPNAAALDSAARRWSDTWDAAEHYWVADETLEAVERVGLAMQYHQISSCAGLYVFSKAG